LVLKERLRVLQTAGIALALAALYLLSGSQEVDVLSGWLAYALLPILLWGGAGPLQKLAVEAISAELSTVWFLLAFVPLAAVLLLGQPMDWSLSPRAWVLATVLGLFYGLGNWTLLAAFRHHGQASVVTPLSGLYPVVSIPLAIFVLGEPVSRREWVGIALALAAAVALSYEPAPSAAAQPVFSLNPSFPPPGKEATDS
jgi:transporter family protein